MTVSDTETERTIRAARVVVSAGAAETPRLLLWSGLGNDHVGDHLQSHAYALAYAKHRDRFHAWAGPDHSWATLDFNHHNPGVIGGGVIHDGTQNLPVAAAGMLANFFGVPRYGTAHTEFMRNGIHQLMTTMACGQQIPSATTRIMLDPVVRDSFGVPVVRFSGASHPTDESMHRFLSDRCVEWLEAMDCTDIVDIGAGVRSFYSRSTTAGEHGAGTIRRGWTSRQRIHRRRARGRHLPYERRPKPPGQPTASAKSIKPPTSSSQTPRFTQPTEASTPVSP